MSEYLVDTSVWVEFLRGEKTAIKKRLEKLLDENRAAVSGIILAELLTGIADEKDQCFLEECFLGLSFLEATRDIFATAGKMGATLHKKGITMPISDPADRRPGQDPCPDGAHPGQSFPDPGPASGRANGIAERVLT